MFLVFFYLLRKTKTCVINYILYSQHNFFFLSCQFSLKKIVKEWKLLTSDYQCYNAVLIKRAMKL